MPPKTMQEKQIDYALLDKCLAHAIAEGDYVNLRFLFLPASPFRADSPEDIAAPKYAYLLPEDEAEPRYRAALDKVRHPETARYLRAQLAKSGPPQLPWELILQLADNAVLLGKYTAASQAYELLRIRRRMQDAFREQGDAALKAGRVSDAVQGFVIASGLDYDYAAFPEPLPTVPNYQERALALHGQYPASPGAALALQPDAALIKTALNYLLLDSEGLRGFDAHEAEHLPELAAGLVRCFDTDWNGFADCFARAHEITSTHAALLDTINSYAPDALGVLFESVLDEEQIAALKEAQSLLLNRDNSDLEWWQCLQSLCYRHPGAALFVRRQRLSAADEILIPLCRDDSHFARCLGLLTS